MADEFVRKEHFDEYVLRMDEHFLDIEKRMEQGFAHAEKAREQDIVHLNRRVVFGFIGSIVLILFRGLVFK